MLQGSEEVREPIVSWKRGVRREGGNEGEAGFYFGGAGDVGCMLWWGRKGGISLSCGAYVEDGWKGGNEVRTPWSMEAGVSLDMVGK